MLERKIKEDQEKAKLLASQKEQYKVEKNKLLRYNESLKLNRVGHS